MININGNFYKNPTFPTLEEEHNTKPINTVREQMSLPDIPLHQSTLKNILRNNKGKKVKIYTSFSSSNEWKDKTFEGTFEQVGQDHIIIKDTNTDKWYIIPTSNLDYIEFDERIDYKDKELF